MPTWNSCPRNSCLHELRLIHARVIGHRSRRVLTSAFACMTEVSIGGSEHPPRLPLRLKKYSRLHVIADDSMQHAGPRYYLKPLWLTMLQATDRLALHSTVTTGYWLVCCQCCCQNSCALRGTAREQYTKHSPEHTHTHTSHISTIAANACLQALLLANGPALAYRYVQSCEVPRHKAATSQQPQAPQAVCSAVSAPHHKHCNTCQGG